LPQIRIGSTGKDLVNRLRKSKAILLALTIILVLTVGIVFGISGYVGWNLTHPARRAIDTFPSAEGLSCEDVIFKSRTDGLNLKGWLIKAPENRQTIIFAHGYGKNRLQSDVPLLPIVRSLVTRGFNVLMFDFRNCGESEGRITSVGQYEVLDLQGAVDFVKSRPELNRKITLYGFSMGASVAIIVGAREQEVAAVIADSPFADLKSFLNESMSPWTKLPSFPFNQTVLMTVQSLTGLNAETVSPIREIKSLNGRPLLLIHGEADPDTPIKNSELLLAEYPEASLVRIPEAKHVQSFTTNNDRYLIEVLNFLEKLSSDAVNLKRES
jgi:dipeptidyl aminopeptidase/acylaminoacyl peptidase